MRDTQPRFDYLHQSSVTPEITRSLRKVAFGGKLGSKLPGWLGRGVKLLVQGNEFEGLETGARMFTGYDAGLVPSLVGSFAFDAARPWLKKGLQKVDGRLLARYGTSGNYGGLRSSLASGHQKFKDLSKWAPAANLAGGVQQATIGFNQFDPAYSIEAGKQNTINSVANSLGYDDVGSLRADVDQLRPVMGAVTGLTRAGSTAFNYLRSPAVQRRLAALDDEQLSRYTGAALNNYGRSFLDRSPYDQAAMIDSLYRQSLQGLR